MTSDYIIDILSELGSASIVYFPNFDSDGNLMVRGMKTVINNGFPAAAASANAAIVGNFDYFRIGYVRGLYVFPMREHYHSSLQIGIPAFYRVGSVVDLPKGAADTPSPFSRFTFKA